MYQLFLYGFSFGTGVIPLGPPRHKSTLFGEILSFKVFTHKFIVGIYGVNIDKH